MQAPGDHPPGGSRLPRGAVLAALAILLAGGGVALALWLTRHDDPVPAKPAADAPMRRMPAGRMPDTNATAADRTAVAAPAAPATGAEQGASTAEGAGSPVGVLRSHWEAISKRRYDAAYALFSSQYKSQTRRRRWVKNEARFAPRIDVAAATVVEQRSEDSAVVYVELVTRDLGAAGDASRCNRFSGRVRVRVVSQGGSWRYWGAAPGATFKPNGTFPKSNHRCRTLF